MNRGAIGKTSKESQVVDEKNNLKRLKGSNSSQKVPETSSKQLEISRPKTVGVAKKTGATGPVLPKISKTKLRSPSKLKPSPTNLQPRVIPQPSHKSDKRHHLEHHKPKSTMKVQQESTEIIPQSKKKELKLKSKADENPPEIVEIPSDSSDTNGKANDSSQSPKASVADNGVSQQPETNEPKEIIISETESTNSEVIDLVELSDDSLVMESPPKPEKIPEEEINVPSEPSKNDANPADILVESTTSESSPQDIQSQVNPTQSSDDQGSKPDEDPSFVSYDSTIMLKDVQIKLNDCLRENSKLMDMTDPNASMSESFKDLSFGRTLRGISGRSSIGRMRHVTLRDRQLTPNDSLFVNTSSASFAQDDALHYAPGFRDSPSANGTFLERERKRKLGAEFNESAKKPKQEENSIFNTSLEYLKNLRRPVQVSTPKAFKFEKSEGNNENITVEIDQNGEPKKWCVVM